MRRRPAETSGVAGSVALLLGVALGVRDVTVLAAFGALIGCVPAVVTLLVANGGVRGVLGLLWRGR